MIAPAFVPNAGRLPVLGCLPVPMRMAVLQLSGVESIDDVLSMQGRDSVTFYVQFSGKRDPEYRKAIDCFRGLRFTGMRLDGSKRYLQLRLQ